MPSRSLRVAVIGAGAAGLVAARELRREGHAPVVFERTDGVGGTWVYEADADASASPEPLVTQRRSNLDASLRTNLPRECMGFLDFPFVAGPDGDTRRFPGHAEVLRYLQSFARRFDLDGLVRLETEVVRVSRETSGTSWRVRYSRKASGSEKRETDEEVFDAVVICNGHYSQPHFADVAGVDAWPGKQLHSTSYRVPEPFHGQVVVVIGCGPSGTDISRDIAGVAKEVHLASRWSLSATSEKLPGHANMWFHSEAQIDRAQEDGSVVFHDGSRVKADVIMHCTGYILAACIVQMQIQVQLPIPHQRCNRLRGRQLCRSTVQACVPATGCSSTLLHRVAFKGGPFSTVRAAEPLGGRRSVGAIQAPI
uniref:Flavin-containing monooxygenase n=1 Tax=Aegilops tauschii subsp. strangulata TaxID=200361 RepID=A0A453NIA3_AEGTS